MCFPSGKVAANKTLLLDLSHRTDCCWSLNIFISGIQRLVLLLLPEKILEKGDFCGIFFLGQAFNHISSSVHVPSLLDDAVIKESESSTSAA